MVQYIVKYHFKGESENPRHMEMWAKSKAQAIKRFKDSHTLVVEKVNRLVR
jgi:hypothetical protein